MCEKLCFDNGEDVMKDGQLPSFKILVQNEGERLSVYATTPHALVQPLSANVGHKPGGNRLQSRHIVRDWYERFRKFCRA